MSVYQYWPENDPGYQGAVCHILTDHGSTATVQFYDNVQKTVRIEDLELAVKEKENTP